MGLPTELFPNDVDETYICTICSMVLEDPVQLKKCEHLFCKACINRWMVEKRRCPIDRSTVKTEHVRKISRPLRNLYYKLMIRCKFHEHGCEEVMSLEQMENHCSSCTHDVMRPIKCAKCSLEVIAMDMPDHDCITALCDRVAKQQKRIVGCEKHLKRVEARLDRLEASAAAVAAAARRADTSSDDSDDDESSSSDVDGGGDSNDDDQVESDETGSESGESDGTDFHFMDEDVDAANEDFLWSADEGPADMIWAH